MNGRLSREEVAQLVARDIPAGSYVNLGIGQPTSVADYPKPDQRVVLHTENGMLGMGPQAYGDDIDPDLINAGKIPVTELPGAAYFHHADSFAMMRGGHLDICVMGAVQVSVRGDLANWHTGETGLHPCGGRRDGSRRRRQAGLRDDGPLHERRCAEDRRSAHLPTHRPACVNRVYTDHAILEITADGVAVRDTSGISVDGLRARLGIQLSSPQSPWPA